MMRRAPRMLDHGPVDVEMDVEVGAADSALDHSVGVAFYTLIAASLVVIGLLGAALIGRWGGLS